MYFLRQIKVQFFSQIVNHQTLDGPPGTETSVEPVEGPKGPDDVIRELGETGREAHENAKEMGERASDLATRAAALEGNADVKPLSTQEALSHVRTSPEEESQAKGALGENATLEQIREYTFNSRVEALSSNTITAGEREIIEADFIAEIAETSGVNAELIGDLRALGFEGAQTWDEGDIASNLEDMTEQLKAMKEEMGEDFPSNKEEFLALWEAMEAETFNGASLDGRVLADQGIQTVEDSQGNITIDPSTPGYTQHAGGTVMGPPGAPYSVGGNTYAGEQNYISPDAGNITYEGLSGFERGELSSSQIATLDNKEHQELIETRFPAEWFDIAVAFVNTEGTIDDSKPMAMASMPGLTAIVSYPGNPIKIEEAPISIGKNGYGPNVRADGEGGAGVPGDRRTQSERVFHFDTASIAGQGNQARPPSRSILGASIQSPEGADKGGRWWHGGREGRFPGQDSYGCVVANQEFMIRLANAVQSAGGGYGYNSSIETGNTTG